MAGHAVWMGVGGGGLMVSVALFRDRPTVTDRFFDV